MTRRIIFHFILSDIQNVIIIELYWTEIVEIIKIALNKRNYYSIYLILFDYKIISALFTLKIRNLSLSIPIFHALYISYSAFLSFFFLFTLSFTFVFDISTFTVYRQQSMTRALYPLHVSHFFVNIASRGLNPIIRTMKSLTLYDIELYWTRKLLADR